ncbi:MAG: uroporphyrinogen decarboxylase family protein [Armatimonadota bacterium]
MTSKERVLTAFAHHEPDRVPIDYEANPGIDRRLKAHFGLSENDNDGLLQALHVDFRRVSPLYQGKRLHSEVPEHNVDPMWGVITRWIEHESGGYWDYCDFPLRNASVEDVENWPMPSPDDFDYSCIQQQCELYKDYCVCFICMPDIINATGMLRSMEQVLIDLLLDDEAGLRLIDRRIGVQIEIVRRVLEAADGGIDLVWLGEDLGTQISPMISHDLFARHIRPRHQPFVDLTKNFGAHPMMHSCGYSSWAFDDFIEMGITVIDTLQPEACNMSPGYLKPRFGDRLSFHGCISTAEPLTNGTVQDVVANVRDTLEIMKPGGGYALAPSHAIQDNTPAENVLAMYESALEFGRY